jgi:putative phage-type endonuclease
METQSYPQLLSSIPQPAQRSKEWYESRSNLITASNIATILSMNPYKSRADYLEELLNPGLCTFTGNVMTAHGNYYEDASIQTYMTGLEYTGSDLGLVRLMDNRWHRDYTRICEHDIHWLAGSVDKLVWPSEIPTDAVARHECIAVENKCPYNRPVLQYGSVKPYYWPQLQINMFILDVDKGDYIEMIPRGFKGQDFQMNVVRMYRDDAWIWGVALPKLAEFYAEWRSRLAKKSALLVKS